jgi:hypothetical protein
MKGDKIFHSEATSQIVAQVTNEFESFVLIPYLARVEYKDRDVCALFAGGRSGELEDPTALSRLSITSSSFRCRTM